MTDYERALQAGAKPVESDYDRALKAGAAPVAKFPWEGPEAADPEDRIGRANRLDREASAGLEQARAAQATPSAAHAALGGLLSGGTANTFPMVAAALAHPVAALPGGDRSAYTNERDTLQRSLDQDKKAQPYAYGAGDFAGTAATTALLPGSTALGRIGTAAGLSAAGSAGDSLSHGEDLATAAKKGGIGGVAGGVLGGLGEVVAKGVGAAVAKRTAKPAEEEAVDGILRDFVGDARPKDRKPARELFNHELEHQPAGAPTIRPRDVLLGDAFKPMIDDLRHLARTDRGAALDKIGEINESINAAKAPLAAKVDAARPFQVGHAVNDFESTMFKLRGETGSKPVVKVLNEAKDNLMETWASTPAEVLRNKLETFPAGKLSEAQDAARQEILSKLPADGYVTRGKLVELLGDHVDDPKLRALIEEVPFKFHPDAAVPYAEIRKATTNAQEAVTDSLGTINETEHAKLKAAVSANLNRSLEKHLNEVAATSPELAQVVTSLRNGDVVQSSTLSLKRGLDSALNTGADKALSLKGHVGNVASNVVAGEEAMHALSHAATGNFAGAVGSGLKAVAAKVVPRAVSGLKADATEALARSAYNNRQTAVDRVARAAASGNARARALLARVAPDQARQAARTATTVNAVPRLTAAVGQVAEGTLGQ